MPADSQKKDPSDASATPSSGKLSREQIECLFKEHNAALMCFINSRLHSWTESKDIAQEAYVRLLGLDQVKTVSYLRAYLYRIAGNLVLDRIRSRDVRSRHEHFVFFEAHERERENPSAETEFSRQQERELLEATVQQLPTRCRLVFTLVELEGKTVPSVAEHLQITPEAVRRLVYRAYEYLAEALSADYAKARRQR